MNKKRNSSTILLSLFWSFSIILSACAKSNSATPTLDPAQIKTQAVATFSVGLTQTALAQPTATATLTPSPTSTETATPTVAPTTGLPILPTSSCNSLTFVSDVSIPDNSKMAPGQVFTKTWRVKNTGDCAWEEDYQVKFFSGNAMEGKSLILGKTVNPGAETNISVNLNAPTSIGVYTGNWRITDDSGFFFGDSFYVMINVVADITPTSTVSTASPTPTTDPTPTETPE